MEAGEIYQAYVHADCGGDLSLHREVSVSIPGMGGGGVPAWKCLQCGKEIDATEYWLFEPREFNELRGKASGTASQGGAQE